MQNHQVTFALQAEIETPPVPEIVLAIAVVSEGDTQNLLVLRRFADRFYPVQKFSWKGGALEQSRADVMGQASGDVVYNFILNHFGVQEAINHLPG